jgi:putative ABC transport system permease protein
VIRHLFKLVWNRKRAKALVIAEIFFSFLVVFVVVTMAAAVGFRWNEPLGFQWNDVWVVEVSGTPASTAAAPGDDPFRGAALALIREVKTLPPVADAALSATPPYGNGSFEGSWEINGRQVRMTRDVVTDGLANVLRLRVLRGRWFHAEDDALDYSPVVIDADLARAMFGSEDPLGKKFDESEGKVSRVVGIIAPYRKDGEFSGIGVNMSFDRVSLTKGTPGPAGGPHDPIRSVPKNILLRLRPGTAADFERQLTARLHAVAPELAFNVRRMDRMRDQQIRFRSAPMILLGVIALFLISMVALGLTGVLWQNVTRRTRELGLRRALGASASSVRQHVLGEVALLATLAVVIGVVLVLQLPILGIFNLITRQVFAFAIVLALAVIYGIALACGLYPSWLASRVEPAEALRYE